MRKILWPLLIGAALLLSGCGSNDFDEPGKGKYDTNSTLTENNGSNGHIQGGSGDGNGSQPEYPAEVNETYQLETVVDHIYVEANKDNTPAYNTKQTVGFYFVNSKGEKATPDFTVKVDTYDTKYGQVEINNCDPDCSIGTDMNGVFVFTPPKDLKGLIGKTYEFNITIAEPAGKGIVHTITVHYGNAGTVDTSNLMLRSTPDEINVTESSESNENPGYSERNISLYLIDKTTNLPVENVAIIASLFDEDNGTLKAYSATTDLHGKATFVYDAPVEIPFGKSFPITFKVADGSPDLTKTVMINFKNAFKIKTVVDDIYIQANQNNSPQYNTEQKVGFYILDYRGNKVTDKFKTSNKLTVKVDTYDKRYGTVVINNCEPGCKTGIDMNGYFMFSPPDNLTGLIGKTYEFNLTIAEPRGYGVVHTLTVHYGNAGNVDTSHMALRATPDEINRVQANDSRTIDLYLIDTSTNLPVQNTAIIADLFDEDNGTLVAYSATTDAHGKATFTYNAPASIPAGSFPITFRVANGIPNIEHNVTITFDVKDVADLMIVPGSIKVTQDGEEHNITIITVNSANVGVSSTVTLEEPTLNGKDYGRFQPAGTITTDINGRAYVIYTAPNISGLSERNITFTEQSQQIAKKLNIKYEQATGPGVDYVVTVKVPDSLSVDSTDQVTVVIHQRGDESIVIPDAQVHEVNVTSVYTNMLLFDNGTGSDTYTAAGKKPIGVKTQTLSGSAVVKVSASVFNGDRDITIGTSVPVTILSGPVTSMSLTYGSTLPDDGTGIYYNTYTVHAVDKYNNPARAGIVLHPSVINGITVNKANATTGKINAGTPVVFSDSSAPFGSVDATKDIVAVLPNVSRMDQTYLGNWSIDAVTSSSSLNLVEAYNGATTDNLSYVIGNSQRYLDGYGVADVDIKSHNGQYVTDANGTVEFIVAFDRVLAGHTVTLSANGFDTTRTGVSKVAGLRWGKYSSTSVRVPNDGSDHVVTLQLSVDDGVEHLIDVDIVPTTIKSDIIECAVNMSAPGNDFHTDRNGAITFTVSTHQGPPPSSGDRPTECIVQWEASQGGIYLEY